MNTIKNRPMIKTLLLLAVAVFFTAGHALADGPDMGPETRAQAPAEEPMPEISAEPPPAPAPAQASEEQVITRKKVAVTIESVPSAADIMVNGLYVGSTPLQITMREGVHNVEIALPGYLVWRNTVMAYDGMTVKPTLSKERTHRSDYAESATSKQ